MPEHRDRGQRYLRPVGQTSSDDGPWSLWKWLQSRIQRVEDPVVATLIWVLFLAGTGVIVWSIYEHNDKLRDGGFAALGGILLLLTGYFTARNLQINARAAFNEQLMRASELLCKPDEPAKVAARATLQRLKDKASEKADRDAVDAILKADEAP